MSKLNGLVIAREYFPTLSDKDLGYILWNHTGWPAFWRGDPETCLRRQLEEYRHTNEHVSRTGYDSEPSGD